MAGVRRFDCQEALRRGGGAASPSGNRTDFAMIHIPARRCWTYVRLTRLAPLSLWAAPALGQAIPHEDELPLARLVEVGAIDVVNAPLSRRPSYLWELSDGTVLLGGQTEILVFDKDGSYRREIGRAGEGPGEFRWLDGLGAHGDTIWASDPLLGRVTRFLSDGSLLEMVTPDASGRTTGQRLKLAPDGSVVGSSLPLSGVSGDPSGRGRVLWWRWHENEGLSDSLVASEVWHEHMLLRPPGRAGGVARLQQPFSERVPVAFGGTERYALAARAVVETDQEALIVVERYHFDGRRDTSVALRYQPLRLTAAAVDSAVNDLGRQNSTRPGIREQAARPTPEIARQLREAIYVPRYYPPLKDLIQGSAGAIWIGRERSASRKANWVIATESEGALARISLADYQRPLSAMAGYVWLLEASMFDLPRIVKYRIEIAPGGR